MEQYLSNELAKSISKVNVKMEDELVTICESFYNQPVHNLQDLKKRNTKLNRICLRLLTGYRKF